MSMMSMPYQTFANVNSALQLLLTEMTNSYVMGSIQEWDSIPTATFLISPNLKKMGCAPF